MHIHKQNTMQPFKMIMQKNTKGRGNIFIIILRVKT